MLNPKATDAEKMKCLRAAIDAHRHYTNEVRAVCTANKLSLYYVTKTCC